MRNFVQSGEMLDLVAPSGGVVAGKLYLIGGLLVVASVTADAGVTFSGATEGVFDLDAKSTDTFAPGDPVYWDAATNGGQVTSTATSNTFVGAATEAKGSGDVTLTVNLFERVFAPAANVPLVAATAATNSTPYGFSQAQANAIVSSLNALITAAGKAGIHIPA